MRALLAVGFVALAGCGVPGNVTVTGKVVWADGSPATELAGSVVQLEPAGDKPGARAAVAADGTFKLGTGTDGDGVPPGDYRVCIAENLLVLKETDEGVVQAPPKMDPKFGDWKTSGLVATVGSGSGELTLKVERAKKARR